MNNLTATEQGYIRAERSPEFYQTARELSDFIKTLPLTAEQNDRLIGLAVQQVNQAERAAFFQGLRMSAELKRWTEEQEGVR